MKNFLLKNVKIFHYFEFCDLTPQTTSYFIFKILLNIGIYLTGCCPSASIVINFETFLKKLIPVFMEVS